MNFAARVVVTTFGALIAHLGLLFILAGGNPPLSNLFLFELLLRWTIAAILANSLNWSFPIFVNALIVGSMTAVNMAFIILTFQQQLAFFQRALITNGTGGVGLAIGAAVAAMLIKKKSDG